MNVELFTNFKMHYTQYVNLCTFLSAMLFPSFVIVNKKNPLILSYIKNQWSGSIMTRTISNNFLQ